MVVAGIGTGNVVHHTKCLKLTSVSVILLRRKGYIDRMFSYIFTCNPLKINLLKPLYGTGNALSLFLDNVIE